MSKTKLSEDVSAFTGISANVLNDLAKEAIYSICNSVSEVMLDDTDDMAEIDIGIGTLCIRVCGREIKYKFVPCRNLINAVSETVVDGVNPLVRDLNTTIEKRLMNTYRELV